MRDWKKVKLGSLLTESRIISKNPDSDRRIRVRLNTRGVEKRPDLKDKTGATKYFLRKSGQFIYGRQNLHKGAFGIIPPELDGFESTMDIPSFDVHESCYPEWIFYFFKKNNFYLKLENLTKGVGSKRIRTDLLLNLDIYLPPKSKQKEILQEIQLLNLTNEDFIMHVEYQIKTIAKLKISVREDALHGKLTKEWRTQNGIVDSAELLLEDIESLKQQLIHDKIIKKEKPLSRIDHTKQNANIPENWKTCRLGNIIHLKSGQDLSPNQYSDLKSIGLPYITGASNINNEMVSVNRWTDTPTVIANKGDLLLVCKGSGVGKMGWLRVNKAHIARQLMAIQVLKGPIEFVKIILDVSSEDFKKNATGLIPGIDRNEVLDLIVNLPPITEQFKIVEEVTQFNIICDKIEQQIAISRGKAKDLFNSALINLLGDEQNMLENESPKESNDSIGKRKRIFNNESLLMDLVEILNKNGKIHAEDLWKMSIFKDNIDDFYAELKIQIEETKLIRESKEKGYLELYENR